MSLPLSTVDKRSSSISSSVLVILLLVVVIPKLFAILRSILSNPTTSREITFKSGKLLRTSSLYDSVPAIIPVTLFAYLIIVLSSRDAVLNSYKLLPFNGVKNTVQFVILVTSKSF